MNVRKYLLLAVFVIACVLLLAEIVLRVTGRYAVYSEKVGLKYVSYYNAVYPTWYMQRTPNQIFTPDNSDFHYQYCINNLGLREKFFDKTKKDSSARIFVTGDSFSEGQGAPYDSTWPHLLANYLVRDSIPAEVLNTGVAGSDPVYNYVFHRDKLKGYKADYLIVAINSSDFTDYMMRGGFERFRENGTTHYKKGPWYEPLYHYSFFARGAIERAGHFPFRQIFATEQDFALSADKAITCYKSVIDSFVHLTAADSTRVIVLMFSTPSEIRYINNEEKIFDKACSTLQAQLAKEGIPCINIWDELKTDLKDKPYPAYSYENDSHYKPYGYNLMAQLIEKKLLQQGIVHR